MSRIRTFIGIDVGEPIRDRLVALQETLGRAGGPVKWVERKNLHVTLLFLGEVDEREVPEVCDVVAEHTANHQAFAMSIESAGCFPNPRRPRVLWVGVGQGVQNVCALHDSLEGPLLDLGCYRREERKYTPHVTLGRVRGERPSDQLGIVLAKNAVWKGGDTTVQEVRVMSSELGREGPVYTVLSRAKLS